MLAIILIILALICFGIPAVRALLNGSVDFTNSGLFLATLSLALPTLSAAL